MAKRVDNSQLLAEIQRLNKKVDDQIAVTQPLIEMIKSLQLAGKMGAYVGGFVIGLLTIAIAIKKFFFGSN